jgi:hypothetical protein
MTCQTRGLTDKSSSQLLLSAFVCNAIHGSLETPGTDKMYKHSNFQYCTNHRKPRWRVPRLRAQAMLNPSRFVYNTLLMQGLMGRIVDCSSEYVVLDPDGVIARSKQAFARTV